MLQTITFDFWGTLYQHAAVREERLLLLEQVLARHDQARPRTDIKTAYGHILSLWERIWREEHRSFAMEHGLDEIFTFLQVDLPQDVIAGLCKPMEEIYLQSDKPQPVHGVSEVLPRLAQR